MTGSAGVTTMDTSVAADTLSVVVPDRLVARSVAVIVVRPGATDVARPLEPVALLMTAMDVTDELHITAVVRSFVVLSGYVPVAIYDCVMPVTMLGLSGVTVMDTGRPEAPIFKFSDVCTPQEEKKTPMTQKRIRCKQLDALMARKRFFVNLACCIFSSRYLHIFIVDVALPSGVFT